MRGRFVVASEATRRSPVHVQLAHDWITERSTCCSVEVNFQPDAGGDAMRAAPRGHTALLQRVAQTIAVFVGEPELGTAGRLERASASARATKTASS
jgi:hypothetical protein